MWCTQVLFTVLCVYWTNGFDIAPKLYQNHLKPEWGINFKYNGEVHHNLDRVWIVTKLQVPTFDVDEFGQVDFDTNCTFLEEVRYNPSKPNMEQRLVRRYCLAFSPEIMMIKAKEENLRNQLKNLVEIDLPHALPVTTNQRQKKSITAAISAVTGIVTLAVEAISSHLKNKRLKAVENGLKALKESDQLQENQLHQFEKEFMMYGKYNLETAKGIVDVLESYDDRVRSLESLVSGHDKNYYKDIFLAKIANPYLYPIKMSAYVGIMRERHNTLMEQLVRELEQIIAAIAQLSKGYLPPELFPPKTVHSIMESVRKMVTETHPEYVLALPHVTHYYDLQLVTFGVDKENNLIVVFPVFLKPHTTASMALYEIETVAVPILDKNMKANSYSEVEISKPYVATNKDYYIQLRIQELRMCKRIRYDYYCEELFLVKHKTASSCEAALFYNLDPQQIAAQCNFLYWFNRTVIPSVLDGGNQIVLANMVDEKRLVCSDNFNLGEPLPSYSYVTVNRSILCNCQIDASLSYIMRSIGSCSDTSQDSMIFNLNMAFQTIFQTLLVKNKHAGLFPSGDQDYVFPIHLENTNETVEGDQVKPVENLKTLLAVMEEHQKGIADRKPTPPPKREQEENLTDHESSQWFMFASGILACVSTVICMYLLYKYIQMKALVLSIALHHGAVAEASPLHRPVECTVPWLSYTVAAFSLLGAMIYVYKVWKKMALWKGFTYKTSSVLYVFLNKGPYFVPVKLVRVPGPLHSLRSQGTFEVEDFKLNKGWIWDSIHIDWSNVEVYYKEKLILVPHTQQIPLLEKWRVRKIFSKKMDAPHVMAKQGINWFLLQESPPTPQPNVQTESGHGLESEN